MASQLVYTSAGKLLDAGRSGFGTVARSRALAPALASAIERVSLFDNNRGNDMGRLILCHRKLIAGSQQHHVLSRIANAGADYTGRTNHLAHHLVVSSQEAATAAARGITPADILRQFPWRSRWEEPARFLEANEDPSLTDFQPLGKQTKRSHWSATTGNPLHSRLLAWEGAPRNGVILTPDHADLLALLSEALCERGKSSWALSFTSCLEVTDQLADFDWIISPAHRFPAIQSRCGSRTLWDLRNPASLPTPSETPVAQTPTAPPAPTTTQQTPPADEQLPKPTLRPVQPRNNFPDYRPAAPVPGAAVRIYPPETRKSKAPLITGIAAAVVLLAGGGVGLNHLNKEKQARAKQEAANQELEKQLSAAKKNLEAAGLDENAIKEFLEETPDSRVEWSKYFNQLVTALRDLKWENRESFASELSSVSPPDSSKSGPKPDIIAALEEIRDSLENYGKQGSDLKPLTNAATKLKDLPAGKIKEGLESGIAALLESFVKNSDGKKLVANKKDFERCAKLLPEFETNLNGLFREKTKPKAEPTTTKIAGGPAQKAPEPAVPKGPDLRGVPKLSLRVVKEKDFQSGVPVGLLPKFATEVEKASKGNNEAKEILEKLKIEVRFLEGGSQEILKFASVTTITSKGPDDPHYGNNFLWKGHGRWGIDKWVKLFFFDTKPSEKIDWISFSYMDSGKDPEAVYREYVIVDRKEKEPVVTDLNSLSLEPKGKNLAVRLSPMDWPQISLPNDTIYDIPELNQERFQKFKEIAKQGSLTIKDDRPHNIVKKWDLGKEGRENLQKIIRDKEAKKDSRVRGIEVIFVNKYLKKHKLPPLETNNIESRLNDKLEEQPFFMEMTESHKKELKETKNVAKDTVLWVFIEKIGTAEITEFEKDFPPPKGRIKKWSFIRQDKSSDAQFEAAATWIDKKTMPLQSADSVFFSEELSLIVSSSGGRILLKATKPKKK